MTSPAATSETPVARVVLLGASNITRAISTVVETAHQLLGQPLEIFGAIGHGRSYGVASRVLLRGLPGIVECGLWDALAAAPASPRTYAVVTDIGNDVVYGMPPRQIARWVEQCVNRLDQMHADIVLTQLPIACIREVPRWRFEALRRVLFPMHSISYVKAMAAAEDLSERIDQMATAHNLETAPLVPAWYGLDPVHIRLKHWPRAWGEILGRWSNVRLNGQVRPSLPRWVMLRRAMPQRWWLAGREIRTEQPSCVLPCGTTISWY